MVKEPRAGRVKSRLGRDIGMTSAAWWYRHQALSTLRRLRDPRWQIVLAVTPDIEGLKSRVWPPDLPRVPQAKGDLGQRMAQLLARTRGPTVLIGSDIPCVARSHIANAFAALGPAETVIGPARDGGFWLIGLRYPVRQRRGFLKGIRWSHSTTLAETLPTLPAPIAMTDTLSDVDTAKDLDVARTSAKPRDATTSP
ncbi:MAG: DUF2064 domain-containing protein [Boseongicola sp.]|nr:DUF2064 domain-containing protein [Boseongicola sp.]